MNFPPDINGRLIVETGRAYCVVCAVLPGGAAPAKKCLEDLLANNGAVLAALLAKFKAAAGYEYFERLAWIKRERGDIWTFKLVREKYRFPFFRDGKSLVLTHGFPKPGQKWREQEFMRAERIMKGDRRRVATLQMKKETAMTTLSQILSKDKRLAPLLEQEQACTDATVLLTELMRVQGVSRTELAKRLKKSKAHVTQLLDGTANMTIRTIANVLFHLGQRLKLGSVPMAEEDYMPSVDLSALGLVTQWRVSVEPLWLEPSSHSTKLTGNLVA